MDKFRLFPYDVKKKDKPYMKMLYVIQSTKELFTALFTKVYIKYQGWN